MAASLPRWHVIARCEACDPSVVRPYGVPKYLFNGYRINICYYRKKSNFDPNIQIADSGDIGRPSSKLKNHYIDHDQMVRLQERPSVRSRSFKNYYLKSFLFYLFLTSLFYNYVPTVFAKTVAIPKPYLDETISGKADKGVVAPSDFIAPNEDNLLIVQMDLGQFPLYDAMPAYLNEGSLLLPLSEFVRAVDFAINVKPESGIAEGWFLKENQLFSLDVQRATAVIKGKRVSYNPALVGVLDDDIFVDARLLSEWFPIDFDIDVSNLLVVLESRQPLPVELRLSRERKRTKALASRRGKDPNYPRIPTPYQLVSWPITDSSMRFNFDKSDSATDAQYEQTTFITGDIGKLSAEGFFASTNEQNFSQARLKLGRQDPDGHMLGALKATEFSFGDISTPQVPMISNSELGRGFVISNVPLDQPSEFDRITLDGDLPVGWEVELYRNEVLLDFRVSRSDGRYEFQNVPLLFGVNVLRLGFYGPQGQFREDVRQIRVGADQVKPGDHQYTVAFNEQETQLLLGDAVDPTEESIQGKNRYFFEYATGVNRSLSLATGLVSIPFTDGRRNYASLSTRASVGSVFGRADIVRDLSEGWAIKLAGQGRFKGVNLIAEHDRLFDFVSEQFESSDDPTEHDTSLRLDGAVRLAKFAHIPYSLTGEHAQQESGDTNTSLSGRMSSAIAAASITKTMKWQLARTASSRTTTVDGSFLIGGRLRDIRVRGQLSYLLSPSVEISSSSISGDVAVTPTINANGGLTVDLGDETVTTFSSGINGDLKYVALGINLSYATTNDISGSMTLSFSSARDPKNPLIPVVSSQRMASGGAMSVRVYLDKNFNDKFDDGDEPLEGIQFTVNGTQRPFKTNNEGFAFITGLDVHTPVNLGVASGTLEDPFWVTRPQGVSLILRPGVTGELNFPVVSTGEIDGTVYRRRGDWSDPVSDAVVQLVDPKGDVVKETKTAYDGFYLLDYVVPGKYDVRIDPDQIARLKLAEQESMSVEIAGDGTVLSGTDFFLELAQRERTYRVLLTSFLTKDAALKAWEDLKKEIPNEFVKLRPMVTLQDLGKDADGKDRGVVHNLFVGPLSERKTGERLCINVRALKGQVWCNPLTIQAR